mgnify:CR=1 FL=1
MCIYSWTTKVVHDLFYYYGQLSAVHTQLSITRYNLSDDMRRLYERRIFFVGFSYSRKNIYDSDFFIFFFALNFKNWNSWFFRKKSWSPSLAPNSQDQLGGKGIDTGQRGNVSPRKKSFVPLFSVFFKLANFKYYIGDTDEFFKYFYEIDFQWKSKWYFNWK